MDGHDSGVGVMCGGAENLFVSFDTHHTDMGFSMKHTIYHIIFFIFFDNVFFASEHHLPRKNAPEPKKSPTWTAGDSLLYIAVND